MPSAPPPPTSTHTSRLPRRCPFLVLFVSLATPLRLRPKSFDSPSLPRSLPARLASPFLHHLAQVSLSITGMTCASCVSAVEKQLNGMPGVTMVSVSLMGKRGQISYEKSQISPSELVDGINSIGFK